MPMRNANSSTTYVLRLYGVEIMTERKRLKRQRRAKALKKHKNRRKQALKRYEANK